MERVIMASKFKEQCLALLDLVATTRVPIVVTKHGRPVARLAPLDESPPPTFGSVTLLCDDEHAYFSTGESWEAVVPVPGAGARSLPPAMHAVAPE